MPLATRSLLIDAARAGDRVVAVGERGHVLISRGADEWRQVGSPVRVMLTGISFADTSSGVAVGHDAVVLRTTDGGETWLLAHADPDRDAPLLDVQLLDARHGLAVGAYGLLLVSDNAGVSWNEHPDLIVDFHLNAIAVNPDAVLVAGESGTVLHSADGGATWTARPFPYEGSLHGALGLGPARWLVFGLRGHVYRSDDDGLTWTQVEVATEAGLMGGTVREDGTVVVVGLGGTVLISRDGARSFVPETLPGRPGLSAAVETPAGDLVLLGEGGARRASP